MMDDLFFTQMKLDRKSSERKSEVWLKDRIVEQNSVFIPMWKGSYFFSSSHSVGESSNKKSTVELSNYKEISQCIIQKNLAIEEFIYFLGETKPCENKTEEATTIKKAIKSQQEYSAVFAVELSMLFPDIENIICGLSTYLNSNVELIGFRSSLAFVDNVKASMLGYGRALSHWHLSAQFCGFCAARTLAKEGGHSRICQNEHCQKLSFPRTDPVVIMLVEYQEEDQPIKCLLAGHTRSPDNLLSTIAGFVDPGESLEQAVIREVYEEVGLEVEQVEYMASQPWAFPNSLMVGFYVKAKTNTINIDTEEISRAHWFTTQEVERFSEWGETGDNFQIPRQESISRYLIDHWLARNNLK
ncbi:MAG: NAD(+) diphosphatase [Thalassotalea sp.]|nr:NAD(+) diphosphatase [Thalassotalea sp.]